MDFGTLLHVAKKNSDTTKTSENKYYSTKFSAPKKETKEKKLSDNIKKFLAKKEAEEREKARIEKEKRDKLLAMRDDKSKNKIRKMLKVIKSANKSVLEDAVDTDHTAVSRQGPDQPDQDDYGYVSTEAAAFYQKYVEKVKDVKDEKPFAPSRPQSRHDLSGTKDRVRAAINKEQDDKLHSQRMSSSTPRVSTASSSSKKNLYDPQAERELEEKRRKEAEAQKKPKLKKPAPPPIDFKSLLKLAEKKQFEPVTLEVKKEEKKEPERLLTMKEKMELEQKKKYVEEREKRKREAERQKMQPNGRIPKLNQTVPPSSNSATKQPIKSVPSSSANKPEVTKKLPANPPARPSSSTSSSSLQKSSVPSSKTQRGPTSSSASGTTSKSSALQQKSSYNGPTREFPPKDTIKPRPDVQRRDMQKTREFPPKDVQRTRQFPPPDVRRSRPEERKPVKRRIYDEDEDEYDSELDDFIDDGDDTEDYSTHIKAIFGYDKSRYRDEDYDDAAMESNFAQQMREEYLSKKAGIMEDLEDMRLEAEEKKRKAIKKKKLR